MASSWIAVAENTVSNTDVNAAAFAIYPNPVNDILHLTTIENGNLEILKMEEHLFKKQLLEDGKNAVDVSALSSGIYLIRFQ
ncbi:MAG: T9SS type A sorting domain-containing protein, partial [Saprospiraceae bacterium]